MCERGITDILVITHFFKDVTVVCNYVFDFFAFVAKHVSSFPTSRVSSVSQVLGKSLHSCNSSQVGTMFSLIKDWGDLSRLTQPRVVTYSNSGFINTKNLLRK